VLTGGQESSTTDLCQRLYTTQGSRTLRRQLRSQKQQAVIAPSSANELCCDLRAKVLQHIRAAEHRAAWSSSPLPLLLDFSCEPGQPTRQQRTEKETVFCQVKTTNEGAGKVMKREGEQGKTTGPLLPAGTSCGLHASPARADLGADLPC